MIPSDSDTSPTPSPAAPETAASWTASIFDNAAPGAFVADWHTKAPEPHRLEPYRNARNVEEFFGIAEKRVSDAQAALRNQSPGGPPRPGPSAPPEAWAAWRTARGLPQSPDDYALRRPDDFPGELWSDTEATDFARLAHEHDLPADTVHAIAAWQQTRTRDLYAQTQRARAESDAALQASEAAELSRRFGPALDTTLRDLQTVAQSVDVPPSMFNPHAPDFAGVHLTTLFAKLLQRIPRGEDSTARQFGPSGVAPRYDLTWAKAAIKPGHPDYEAITNSKHPRHAELTEARNAAYALGMRE